VTCHVRPSYFFLTPVLQRDAHASNALTPHFRTLTPHPRTTHLASHASWPRRHPPPPQRVFASPPPKSEPPNCSHLNPTNRLHIDTPPVACGPPSLPRRSNPRPHLRQGLACIARHFVDKRSYRVPKAGCSSGLVGAAAVDSTISTCMLCRWPEYQVAGPPHTHGSRHLPLMRGRRLPLMQGMSCVAGPRTFASFALFS